MPSFSPSNESNSLIGDWKYIPVSTSEDYLELLALKKREEKDDVIVNIGGTKREQPGVTDYHQFYFQVNPISGASAIIAYNFESKKIVYGSGRQRKMIIKK